MDVSAAVHKRGVGSGLYTALFELLRLQGVFNVYTGITLPNEASVGLHTAMGFEPVGVYQNVGFKLGQWWDVGWWRLTLKPDRSRPSPLRTPGELAQVPEWSAALHAATRLVRGSEQFAHKEWRPLL